MKALVTCEESKALDAATREILALSSLQLMEKASLRLWDAIKTCIASHAEIAAKGKAVKIVALCGKGDNGGDAMAILRHAFSAGYKNLDAVISARELSESAKKQVRSLAAAGLHPAAWKGADDEGISSLLSEADIILDGILGTGLSGAAANEAKEMIDSIGSIQKTETGPLVISIDLPSGLGDSWEEGFPCVRADITLCLEPAKTACYLP
ncbi:MAG: NAD(P)H-hydrate epimerase, partial [Spirochaetales bacterium]